MDKTRNGFLSALAAMILWGLLPVYWKQMSHVPAYEILCHRILWSLLASAFFLSAGHGWARVRSAAGSAKSLSLLALSGSVVGMNWLLYIWSVNSGYVLQCSLGYYINPLINVLLGFLVFRDRLRPIQWAAIAMAGAGVLYQVILYGEIPWISLGLACSFALYGLVRKIVAVDSLPGLFLETAFLAIPAGAFLLWSGINDTGTFLNQGMRTDLYLAGSGIVTSVPLLWFVSGARGLSLVTIGMLQFISPTLQFVLGHWVYGEPFSMTQMITFGTIWIALAIYTADSVRRNNR